MSNEIQEKLKGHIGNKFVIINWRAHVTRLVQLAVPMEAEIVLSLTGSHYTHPFIINFDHSDRTGRVGRKTIRN